MSVWFCAGRLRPVAYCNGVCRLSNGVGQSVAASPVPKRSVLPLRYFWNSSREDCVKKLRLLPIKGQPEHLVVEAILSQLLTVPQVCAHGHHPPPPPTTPPRVVAF